MAELNIECVERQTVLLKITVEGDESEYEIYGGTACGPFSVEGNTLTARPDILRAGGLYDIYARARSSAREWRILAGVIKVQPRVSSLQGEAISPREYVITVPITSETEEVTGMNITVGVPGPQGPQGPQGPPGEAAELTQEALEAVLPIAWNAQGELKPTVDRGGSGVGSLALGYGANTVDRGDGYGTFGGVAIGVNAAAGYETVSIGSGAAGGAKFSVVIGPRAIGGDNGVVVIGAEAKAINNAADSVVVGRSATVYGQVSVAIGYSAQASGSYSVVLGFDAISFGDGEVSIGQYAETVSGIHNVALGYRTRLEGSGNVGIGEQAKAKGDNGIAIGGGSWSVDGGMAIGRAANAEAKKSMALGDGARAAEAYSAAIGINARTEKKSTLLLNAEDESGTQFSITLKAGKATGDNGDIESPDPFVEGAKIELKVKDKLSGLYHLAYIDMAQLVRAIFLAGGKQEFGQDEAEAGYGYY